MKSLFRIIWITCASRRKYYVYQEKCPTVRSPTSLIIPIQLCASGSWLKL